MHGEIDKCDSINFMLASDFELINLAATLADPQPMPESSDDGLDPNEFLSQSHTFHGLDTTSRNHTVSPIPIENLDMTPTFLNSDLFVNPNRLSDSGALADSVTADSFHFVSADSMYRNTHSRMSSTGESPLEHLQTQNDALNGDMRKLIRGLASTLTSGDDCTDIRESLVRGFALLSENRYLLHEIYNKELAFVNALLANFENWDRRRSKVLRRIQSIKSEGNKHGKKLAGLLNKRSGIDDEIRQLESRIAVLRANRSAINKEIDETSSVLESKSAKYVNLFREFEKQGRDAISEYLYSSGLPRNHLEVLLKSEPVDATFSYVLDDNESDSTLRHGIQPERKEPEDPKLTSSNMQIQPLIIPEDAPQQDSRKSQPDEESAYAIGYARGSQQLEKLRKGLNNIVTQVFPPVKNGKPPSNVDDHQNTITEKIDLVPIIELLTHKLDALAKLTVTSSKMSAEYHDNNIILKDIYRSLNANERAIVALLSTQNPSLDEIVALLSKSFTEVRAQLEQQIEHSRSRPSELKSNYLTVILHHELTAIARAIRELTHDSSFEAQVPLLGNSLDSSMLDSRLESRPTNFASGITSAGYFPSTLPTTSHASTSVYKVRHNSPFASSAKGLKIE